MMLRIKKVAEKFGGFIFISYFCPRLPSIAAKRASKVFGVSVVTIYGKASSCALFLTIRNLVNFNSCQSLATIDAHVAVYT